jgi:GNAT superfamily N-acetyltransferase
LSHPAPPARDSIDRRMTGKLTRLGSADVADLIALAAMMGWESSPADWELIAGAGLLLGQRDEDDGLISCGALFDYGAGASIGRMMVHPRHQRRGLGAALLSELLTRRSRSDGWVSLSASQQGRRLYEQAGFRTVGMLHKLVAPRPDPTGLHPGDGTPLVKVEPADSADVPEILAFDRRTLGADRGRVLVPKMKQAVSSLLVRDGAGEVIAYALALRRQSLTVIGPVVAASASCAFALVRELGAAAPGPVRVDVPDTCAALLEALRNVGADELDRRAAMILGPSSDRPLDGVYALAGHDFG